MIQSEVTLDHATHTYTDRSGKVYASVSKVLDGLEHKEDWNSIAGKVAGRGKFRGLTKNEVLALWDNNRDKAAKHGSRIHSSLERYSKEFKILPEDDDLKDMIKSVQATYNGYYRTFDECTLYHSHYNVAGTADKILLPTKDAPYFDVEDFKTNLSRGIEHFSRDNKYLKFPVSHLQDANYNRYSLQTSIYAFMMEELTGMRCRHIWIRFVPAKNPVDHFKIPIPYLRTDAMNILNDFSHPGRDAVEQIRDSVVDDVLPNFDIN